MITDKQKRFVELYLANGLNATKAYIEAGYSNKMVELILMRLIV